MANRVTTISLILSPFGKVGLGGILNNPIKSPPIPLS